MFHVKHCYMVQVLGHLFETEGGAMKYFCILSANRIISFVIYKIAKK